MKTPALTLNQKLAALALALGTVALASQPHRGPFVTLDARELAMIVEQEVDHVAPSELAGWIIEGRSDYRLIDLRPEQDFAAYHIPTAEQVPLPALADYPWLRSEKIVLYSDGGIHAAQAWFLMRAQGYTGVYTIRGGLEGWKDEVLFPSLPAEAGPQERARFERAAAVAQFFGGQTRSGDSPTEPATSALPTLASPVAPGARPFAPKKKKKEGC
jgi:rhodanese-related sulfurtransferase